MSFKNWKFSKQRFNVLVSLSKWPVAYQKKKKKLHADHRCPFRFVLSSAKPTDGVRQRDEWFIYDCRKNNQCQTQSNTLLTGINNFHHGTFSALKFFFFHFYQFLFNQVSPTDIIEGPRWESGHFSRAIKIQSTYF